MESFSRTLETYTGSYLAQRRRKRIAVALSLLASLILLSVIVIRLGKSGTFSKIAATQAIPKQRIIDDWTGKNWDAVFSESTASLASRPLDSFYLSMRGLSAFYKGMDLPEGEERAALIDETIITLRKAIATQARLPLAQVEYVLGKAYFFKGDAYFDEATKYLEQSISSGYLAADSREYLALAYYGLGDKANALMNFEKALEKSRADMLLIAAAKAYIENDLPVKAEALLLEAIANGKDELARENGRFLLSDIYKTRGDFQKASEQLNQILAKNDASAEAHYRLGLISQTQGDPVKARSEWRKAVSIDPMHASARQKLSEKL
jgi:tetratricopeptide (TPR) repeat protein